jgi:translocation and assembly module TamB
LLSDTRDLRAVANPDVQVRYAGEAAAAGHWHRDRAVGAYRSWSVWTRRSASPDVVVLDPVDPEDTGDSPLDMDLTIALGNDVKLRASSGRARSEDVCA